MKKEMCKVTYLYGVQRNTHVTSPIMHISNCGVFVTISTTLASSVSSQVWHVFGGFTKTTKANVKTQTLRQNAKVQMFKHKCKS
jgi:hypothetical protein